MDKIKLGIIGAGRIGKLHVDNLKNLKNVEIKSISDIFVDNIKEWAEQNGIQVITDNYMNIINDPEINAVFICSPTDTHVQIIKDAAKAGKHIFCEKPISFSLEQTVQLLETLRQSKVKFQTGFNRRFDHNMSRVQELVSQGKVGDPHILKITSRDPAPPHKEYIKNCGGLFIDMSIHDFDIARFVIGSEVEEVYVQGAVLVDPVFAEFNDIDTAIISLKFKNGALGVIDNSRQAHYYDQRVEVFGSKGCVTIQNDFPNSAELSTADGVQKDKPLYFFLERYNTAYINEVQAFIEAILNDTPVLVNQNDGFQAELIAHAAKLSYLEKRPVRIEEITNRLVNITI
ncbi:inositol 2-dehydrogenase [Paenibacillus alginolyticus]|uniref:inositol 2-dehydrogenase n=1 Tax=Paenibacillus alginolyticus TaxID=59839 RepID=UPI0004233BDB|nr:inositol 2-dehydrogenase [Paenibacillus alginolyticus]MCY9665777.1 inositol 2-dehydrogenase [Paenibacillus alginolyticus]